MVIVEFGLWWYGTGWAHVARASLRRIRGIAMAFSLPILIRTLFQPWRRIITYSNHSFQESLRALLDNTISRCVGFGVRMAVMVAAVVLMTLTGLVGLITVICWPLLPIAGVALIIRGLFPW